MSRIHLAKVAVMKTKRDFLYPPNINGQCQHIFAALTASLGIQIEMELSDFDDYDNYDNYDNYDIYKDYKDLRRLR